MNFSLKDRYNMDDLIEIMRIVRGPEGCMWDRSQSHESIRPCVIEEAYEVADAIDRKDDRALCEELGDLLLQVVYHSEIAGEEGKFNIDDVADGISKKLIRRHPHIFGDKKLSSPEEISAEWDRIKAEEKGQKTFSETAEAVPANFPALMRSQKVRSRLAKSGFDYPDVYAALENVESEIKELKAAIDNKDEENTFEELGDVLFSAVNVARFLDMDAETALTRSCEKFMKRFKSLEKLAEEKGIDTTKSTLEELNNLWYTVKSTGV